jgi:hypothetical protein
MLKGTGYEDANYIQPAQNALMSAIKDGNEA